MRIMALVHLNYFSRVLGMGMGLDVILPERNCGIGLQGNNGWDGTEELPVLYLLHGTSEDHTTWQRCSSLERYAAGKKLAIVLPATHLGAYTNQYFGFRYFDHIAKEVPEICQSYFHISKEREKNFIGGLSMGGYGALKIGLRCSHQFSRIIGLAPGCDRAELLPECAAAISSIQELASKRDEMGSFDYNRAIHFFLNFGSVEKYNASRTENLFNLISDCVEKGISMPRIFLTCGQEDEMVLQANRNFHAALLKLGVEHIYYEAPGKHDWPYWDSHIQKALEWLPLCCQIKE